MNVFESNNNFMLCFWSSMSHEPITLLIEWTPEQNIDPILKAPHINPFTILIIIQYFLKHNKMMVPLSINRADIAWAKSWLLIIKHYENDGDVLIVFHFLVKCGFRFGCLPYFSVLPHEFFSIILYDLRSVLLFHTYDYVPVAIFFFFIFLSPSLSLSVVY